MSPEETGGTGQQTALLLGSAGLTMAILVGAFLVFSALTASDGQAHATPSPTSAAPSTDATPSRTPRPSATPVATATPLSTATPIATPRATSTPPSGQAILVSVPGNEYADANIPSNGSVTDLGNGAIQLTTNNTTSDQLTVTYRAEIPAGKTVVAFQVKVCGAGSGNFWETYGPPGSQPDEYEYLPPAADGCWHFSGGAMTDTTVLAIIFGNAQMRVDRVDYLLTVR